MGSWGLGFVGLPASLRVAANSISQWDLAMEPKPGLCDHSPVVLSWGRGLGRGCEGVVPEGLTGPGRRLDFGLVSWEMSKIRPGVEKLQ